MALKFGGRGHPLRQRQAPHCGALFLAQRAGENPCRVRSKTFRGTVFGRAQRGGASPEKFAPDEFRAIPPSPPKADPAHAGFCFSSGRFPAMVGPS